MSIGENEKQGLWYPTFAGRTTVGSRGLLLVLLVVLYDFSGSRVKRDNVSLQKLRKIYTFCLYSDRFKDLKKSCHAVSFNILSMSTLLARAVFGRLFCCFSRRASLSRPWFSMHSGRQFH